MPPIFFRQIFDVNARKTYREIVDGCQRVRAILDYAVTEDFAIKGTHNREFGGMKFSDLAPETQESILEYEILAEVVVDNDESIIHEMFARLESVPGRKKTSAPVPQMA